MIMICNLGISGKNKHKFMSEPDICVLLERENMFFLEKFIALAKILNCRRQWRKGQISSVHGSAKLSEEWYHMDSKVGEAKNHVRIR